MMKKIIVACLFCLLFTGGISYSQDSYIVNKSMVTGEPGDVFVVVDASSCGVPACNGAGDVLSLEPNDKFVLCWRMGDAFCETGPLIVAVEGVHYFKIYAHESGKEQTFDRYDPDTGLTNPETYTLPPVISEPSNEVVLLVEDRMPDKPGGCSVRKLF